MRHANPFKIIILLLSGVNFLLATNSFAAKPDCPDELKKLEEMIKDDDFFEGSADTAVSYQTTGSFVGKYIGDYYIRDSDPQDHRVWQIEVGET